MSAFLDKADAIKARLEAITELSGIDVLVDRQKDLRSEFTRSMAKAKGAAIIIFFSGYDSHEPGVTGSEVTSEYSVWIWSKPVLKDGSITADEILSNVHTSLNGWISDDTACRNKTEVSQGRLVSNNSFLIYEVKAKIKHRT